MKTGSIIGNTPRRCRICLLTRSSELLSSATNALSIRWWTGSEKNIAISDLGGGKYEVTVMASPNAMEYWAMQYLNYVEIKTPAELRARIKNNLQKAEEKYK